MLPSHLSRMINECVAGNYADQAVRERIKNRCILFLSRHRRELLVGSYVGRHERPAGYIQQVLHKASLIRKVVNHAHQQLILAGQPNNVVSLQAARERRCQFLAS